MEKIRVAAYCRVSTESDMQLNSFESQKLYFEKGALRHSKADGTFRRDCNTYSRWDDQEQCRERARSHYTNR